MTDDVKVDYEYPSYELVLKAMGMKVMAFEKFGSYQGDWWAKVNWNGKTGWIHEYFGSCSGCDALEAWIRNKDEKNDWDFKPTKKDLAEFGQSYVGEMMSYDEALKKASENLEWDDDADPMVKFIKNNK